MLTLNRPWSNKNFQELFSGIIRPLGPQNRQKKQPLVDSAIGLMWAQRPWGWTKNTVDNFAFHDVHWSGQKTFRKFLFFLMSIQMDKIHF
jgi:hypothetical protein